ncbi:MAG: Lrp/AsnC family transcriptional regulator [Rhodocyclaceae bacterium]
MTRDTVAGERPESQPADIDDQDRALINALQGGFPLSRRPFAEIGAQLGMDEAAVLARIDRLLRVGVLTRFGPMFQVERMGGRFCLAAMAVPEARFEAICAVVNGFPEVAHNYRREHAMNMWFVIATERPERVADVAADIERRTGLVVNLFPKEREYFVDMRLKV